MRSFIAVAAGVLLLVCASLAAPSVKLPKGFSVPENAKLTGEMLFHSIAHSQKTLPREVDVSTLAADTRAKSTLLGSDAKRPATLVIIPEEISLEEASGELANNAFPLMEMSLTLSTSIVEPGMSQEMKEAFYYEDVNKIYAGRIRMSEVSSILSSCGVSVVEHSEDHSFSLNGVDFDIDAAGDVIYAAALACRSRLNDQVTVVDLRSAYNHAKKNYGSSSPQVEAVEKMIRSILEVLDLRSMSFVLATNTEFYANQMLPEYDFAVVPPELSASLKKSANEKVSSPNTGIFQITLWFTIFVCLVILIFAVLTCGVGVDIEKDTLLYQTTALRGQPVL